VIAGLQRSTPLYYPDEYIYSTIARSIATTGLPSLRGSALHFPALLGPYLMAPWWLIGDVGQAYHAVLAAGGVVFSAVVFPAYALGRRVGVSTSGALAVALLAVLVPDAAFTTCALTESYAYPLFVATVLVMIDAIASPTRRRQVGVLVLIAALCLLRAQFVVLPVAYLVATFGQTRTAWRDAWRTHRAAIGVTVIGILAAIAGARYYTGLGSHWTAVFSIWPWLAIDLLVLSIAAGWALVPSALVGLKALWASPDSRRRTFAIVTVSTTVLIVLQAAYFDAIQHRIHERYTFYAVPLLAVAALYALETVPRRSRYALIAYGLAVAVVLIPATSWFHNADPSQAPAVLGLQTFGTGTATLVWAATLALVAVLVAQLRSAQWAPLFLAILVSGVLGLAGTRALLRYAPVAHPGGRSNIDLYSLGAPSGSTLVTWAGTDRYVLMKTLFWTRGIKRVLVLGGGPATDGYGSTGATFGSRGITDLSGRPINGPFAFDLDTTALPGVGSPTTPWVRRSPQALILGLTRQDGYLGTGARVLVAPEARPRSLVLSLRSSDGRKQLTFECGTRKFRVAVGATPVGVRIPVPASSVERCRISLTRGAAVDFEGSVVSGVQVDRLALVDTKRTS
jgi:hypothetical protein